MRRKESRNQVTLQSSFFLISWLICPRDWDQQRQKRRQVNYMMWKGYSAPCCLDRVCFARFSNWKRSKAPGSKVKEAVGLTYMHVCTRGIEMSAGWRKCRWGCNADVCASDMNNFQQLRQRLQKFSATCHLLYTYFNSHLCFSAILF
jgi:hypothetical protein